MKKHLLFIATLLFILTGSTMAQTRTIKGRVTSDEDGTPLPGANVVVTGQESIGTITGADGSYSLNVPANTKALTFMFVGMENLEITIDNRSIVDAVLKRSIVGLEEVVVTALGIERAEKALGFAVQELDEDELTAAREPNITGYLTAKVAGVQVSKTSSGTGGSSSVTIRGNSSISGSNQPLYVVDGVPIINDPKSSGGLWGDNDYGDGIGDINPEDVESMSVLKGPNASALYGSRGANGVILITTKSGKKGRGITVEVNSNFSIETLNLFPNYQNKYATGYEGTNIYGSLVEIPEGSGNFYETMDTWHGDSWGPPLDGRRTIVDPFVYPEDKNTRTRVLLPEPEDNVRNFYETGMTNSNTLAIIGRNERGSTRLSLGNTLLKGIVPNHKVQKYNMALRSTSKVSKWLSFDSKINYIHTDGTQRPFLGSSRYNVNRTFATMGRYVPMDWLEEYYETTGSYGRWPGVNMNPYYVVNEVKNNDYRDRVLGYASATLTFTKWLSLMGRVGADFYTEYQKRIYPYGDRGYSLGRFTTNMRNYKDINADALLTASGQLSDDLSGSFSLGASLLSQRRDTEYMDARELKAKGVYNVSNAVDLRPDSYLWQKQMQSLYFIGQLAYRDYLFLDLTGRNDWSSALGLNNQSFFYPSAGLSFIFSEAFTLDQKIFSFGKLRLSWAQVGNDSDPYLTKAGYNSYTNNFLGQGFASKSETLPLFDLKNELSESWEIGTDLRFLQNRVGLDLTYYNGHTTNQILPISVSSASGYSRVIINAGRVSNKGLEAILNLRPIDMGNSFRWDISFNYARNTSMVEELAPGIENYQIASHYPNDIYANPGEPFGTIVGYKTKKNPDGRYIVNASGAYARESKVSVLGNITPDWIGGLNNTFSYKGFSANILIDFVMGGELSSATKYQMTAKGTGKFTEEGRRPQDTDDAGNQLPYVGVLDGVVEVLDASGNVIGYEENTQAVDGQTYWASRAWGGPTDWFVLDGSYISLREIMLSYRFQPSALEKTPFKGISISLVGRNLLYLEEHMQDLGISPESAPNTSAGYAGIESFAIPTTRTWGMNLKLAF
ncbi:MAG: hypothetical protein CSA96_02305 [Bacteroidetes bacterium]|nr:MAG: hypothetical protein CSA96_02305 [Bacteroidota bacterium]